MTEQLDQLVDFDLNPEVILPERIVSSDFHIVARKTVEISTREGNSFGKGAVGAVADEYKSALPKAVFNISDGSGYLDLCGSYITGTFQAECKSGAEGAAAIEACLDKGGIHSCISEIRMKIGNCEIFRQQYYNKARNAMTFPTLSEQYIDSHEARALDSVEDFGNYRFTPLTYTVVGSSYDHAGGAVDRLLTIANASLLTDVRSGDFLRITTGAAVALVRVNVILTNTTLTLQGAGLGQDVAAIDNVEVARPPTRTRVVNSGQGNRFILCLSQDFLKQSFYLPLPFLLRFGSLELELFMEDAAQALVLKSGAANNAIGYVLKDLKLHCSMMYLHEEVVAKHKAIFDNSAIRIPYVRYDSNLFNITASGAQNFNIQTNKNSIQRVLGVFVRTDRALTVSTASQTHFSQSTFNKLNLTNYQFKIGAYSWPDYGVVDASGADNWLTWEELQQAVTMYNRKLNDASMLCKLNASTRIKPAEWSLTTSNKFILGSAMSKDGSFFSGQSARLNNVQCNLLIGANNPAIDANNAYTLMLFTFYDCLLEISAKSGVVVYE